MLFFRIKKHILLFKKENNLSPYFEYIQGKISRDDLYSIIPRDLTKDILNKEISKDTIPSIFEFIDQKLGNNDLDGIIGGPPCQAYSTIGRANNKSKNLPIRGFIYINII